MTDSVAKLMYMSRDILRLQVGQTTLMCEMMLNNIKVTSLDARSQLENYKTRTQIHSVMKSLLHDFDEEIEKLPTKLE